MGQMTLFLAIRRTATMYYLQCAAQCCTNSSYTSVYMFSKNYSYIRLKIY